MSNTISFKKFKVIFVACGSPCSGKTTLANKLVEELNGICHISNDQFLYDNGTYIFSEGRHKDAIDLARAEIATRICINDSHIVYDSTMCERNNRIEFTTWLNKTILQIERPERPDENDYYQYIKVAIKLPLLSLNELLERNANRADDRRIPIDYIRHCQQLMMMEPPFVSDGFHMIIGSVEEAIEIVQILDDPASWFLRRPYYLSRTNIEFLQRKLVGE